MTHLRWLLLALLSAVRASEDPSLPPKGAEGKSDGVVCPDRGDSYPQTFIPTKNFATVKKGQSIPKGLHVRVNMETGHQEAKLIDPQDDISEKAIDVQVNMETGHQEAKLIDPQDDISEKAINVQMLGHANQGAEDSSNTPSHKIVNNQDPSKSRLTLIEKQAFDELIQQLENSAAVSVKVLDALIESVHHVDYAISFANSQTGLESLKTLGQRPEFEIKIKTLLVLGASLQNNPEAQRIALKKGFIPYLKQRLESEESHHVMKKLLYAIGALIRSNMESIQAFQSANGFTTLAQIYKDSDLSVKKKIIRIMCDVLEDDMFPSGKGYVFQESDAIKWTSLLMDSEFVDGSELLIQKLGKSLVDKLDEKEGDLNQRQHDTSEM